MSFLKGHCLRRHYWECPGARELVEGVEEMVMVSRSRWNGGGKNVDSARGEG